MESVVKMSGTANRGDMFICVVGRIKQVHFVKFDLFLLNKVKERVVSHRLSGVDYTYMKYCRHVSTIKLVVYKFLLWDTRLLLMRTKHKQC